MFEIFVGGRDEAHLAANRFIAAEALESALLQQAQEFRLCGKAHVADLVEKQRAAIGLLKFADFAFGGARERAFFVTQKFAFQQGLRNRGAIDRKKSLIRAPAVLVNRARHQFLAGAAFAHQEHPHIAGGHPADHFINFLNGGAVADDVINRPIFGWLGLQQNFSTHQPPDFECLINQSFHAWNIERFFDIFVRPVLHGRDDTIAAAVRGDDQYRRFGGKLFDLLQRLQSRQLRHLYIQNHQVRHGLLNEIHSLAAVLRFENLVGRPA
ncbi:MAG: hypothetical protein ALAOOOJD_01428 [bacterium]|nr:hypothetical protein [bacterium]